MSTAVAQSLSTSASAAGRVHVQVLDPTLFGHWDQLLGTHPEATFFHTRAWATALTKTYNFECRYVTATRDGRLLGLLPLMEARSWIRGVRGVSLPFTDECTPLVSCDVYAEDLLETALNDARSRDWKYLEFCGEHSPSFGAGAPAFYTHRLSLETGPECLFQSFDGSVRRAVRKAERAGVVVRFSKELEALETYYRLHCRTRTRHGAPPQPFRFFRSLCDHIIGQGQGFVALAYHQDRPISGAVFFHFGSRALYKFSASDERFQHLRGSNLVIWKTLEELLRAGMRELSFGRTSLANAGLRRFKLSWGAHESTISRARYCLQSRSFVKMRDLALGPHTRVCARLPMFISRWIGSLAYPHLT
jgi:hypothetical protein